MKQSDKRKLSNDFKQLKVKIILNSAVLLIIAIIVIQLLYSFVFHGHFANWIVALLENTVYRNRKGAYDLALEAYRHIFRNYIEWYFFAGIVAVFIIVLRFYLNNFIKYFNEINKGIDALISEETGDVSFPAELVITEKKINSIKHTLEKRKLDAQLAEQRKNDLIIYLAHDLKTPLTSIIGYLTLLKDEPEISSKLRCRYAGIALEKAERLEDLINEFFDITRFNLTTLTLETQQIHFSRMLEQITNEFIPVLEEKELFWRTDIMPEMEITGDPDKLARVFDNLIRNAVNYSFPETEIYFSAKKKEDQVEILIQNHGKTILPDKLEHIFEQFYRIDASRASKNGGAGLGLAIAKEIVELHEGMITAASEDNSITFMVILPADRKEIV